MEVDSILYVTLLHVISIFDRVYNETTRNKVTKHNANIPQ